MTDDIAKIKAAAEKATPGKWITGPVNDCEVSAIGDEGDRTLIATIEGDYGDALEWPEMEANAEFIALARNSVIFLITRMEAAEARASQAFDDGIEAAAKVAHQFGEAFRVRHQSAYAEGYADCSDTVERAIRAMKDDTNG